MYSKHTEDLGLKGGGGTNGKKLCKKKTALVTGVWGGNPIKSGVIPPPKNAYLKKR